MPKTILYSPEVDKQEHEDQTLPPTKRVLLYGWDSDGSQKVRAKMDSDGVLATSATVSISGMSTEAKQDDIITELQLKADLTETQPVSATSLPLPAGAATSAKQLADGHNVVVTSAPTTAVTGAFYQATQPVSLASVPSHAVTNAGTFAVTETAPITGFATSSNQTSANTLLGGIAGLTPSVFDYISLTYTGSNLTGVVFKTGGSGGTAISTLTLGYDGSDNLTSVTKA